jgi:hypothetical protein
MSLKFVKAYHSRGRLLNFSRPGICRAWMPRPWFLISIVGVRCAMTVDRLPGPVA